MPTARLPDINTAFARYRAESLDAARNRDYPRAFGAFDARNALVPADVGPDGRPLYRVLISNALYREAHRHLLIVTCPHCKAMHTRKAVRVLDVRMTASAFALSGRRRLRMWQCRTDTLLPPDALPPTTTLERSHDAAVEAESAEPDRRAKPPKSPEPQKACGRQSRLDASEHRDRHHAKPHYCGIVPEAPRRPYGIGGAAYRQAVEKWLHLAHAELEGKSAEYRDAHWTRGADEDDMAGSDLASIFAAKPLEDE